MNFLQKLSTNICGMSMFIKVLPPNSLQFTKQLTFMHASL